nr:hypothetical protein [Escherichia coli]
MGGVGEDSVVHPPAGYCITGEYGQYSVILLVEGFPPSHAGTITVYEDSKPGTLNDFLGAMTEDDVRPEV